MTYRDAITVRHAGIDYTVDVDGNVERKPAKHKFKGEMTEATIQRVRQKAADLRAVRDEAEQRKTVKVRRMMKTQSQKVAEQNKKAIEDMRRGQQETSDLLIRVARGELTAGQALQIKCS